MNAGSMVAQQSISILIHEPTHTKGGRWKSTKVLFFPLVNTVLTCFIGLVYYFIKYIFTTYENFNSPNANMCDALVLFSLILLHLIALIALLVSDQPAETQRERRAILS